MPSTISPVSERPSGTESADSRLEIDSTRARQTDRPVTPFRDVLTGGVSLLMSGAEVATHVVAGPVMAAAVHDARVGAVSALGGGTGGVGVAAASPLGGAAAGMTGAAASPLAALSGQTGPSAPTDMSNVQSMMQDGQSSNMQLLALQQQIQEESQRFSTVSNVMRAKFDTAKAAVSNIRA
jgi:cell division ATPase FtsA